MKKVTGIIAKSFIAGVVLMMTLWSILAIYYSNLPWQPLRLAAAIIFPLICIVIFFVVRPFIKAVLSFLVLFGVVLVWWLLIPPSNDRNWQPDVAILPSAVIDGDMLTIRNIRNFEHRTKTEYDVSYYDKTFDLSKLQGADLFISFWGSPLIAHTLMTFCFEDDRYLCVSIETRKETHEKYSSVKGFFKQYELIYILADERDLIKLRTNFREEAVYLYRLSAKPELVREVLLNYVKTVNELNDQPQWYNALTQNCTTAIRGHNAPFAYGKMSWKIIVNGYLDSLLYERKMIDTSMTFEQMKAASRINDKALKAGDSEDFSVIIREGLPNPHSGKQ